MNRVAAALLTIVVALAFADASIVALALPPIYGEFDTTIVGVSWVLTSYAAVVAVAGLLVALFHRRIPPIALTVAGLVVFTAASVLCGLAGSLPVLIVGRCVQALGAALLLAGSLAVLDAVAGEGRGRRLWSIAAMVGLAVGPALGGALTQAFDWRAIFLAQAPVGALALAVVFSARARQAGDRPADLRGGLLANIAFVFVFAALVGALFLGVLLLVEVWRYTPLLGAAVMSAVPAGAFLVRPLALVTGRAMRVLAGTLLLATGLATLALLPAVHAGWAAGGLALSGAGFGLVASVLDPVAVAPDGGFVRASSLTVSARHAGLVLGLVLIAPVLADSLERATEDAAIAGTGYMLDARVPADEKVSIALAVRDQIVETPRGEMPDLARAIERSGADSAEAKQAGRTLTDRVENVLTASFRTSFGLAALLAVVALLPGLWLAWRRRADAGGRRRWLSASVLVVLVLAGGGVVVAEVAAGARDFGRYAETDGCRAPIDSYPGGGFDATVQRIALSALNGAACELGVSRERLLLSLDSRIRIGSLKLDRATVERALRAGLLRAINDAEQRGELPGWAAGLLRELSQRVPLDWLLQQLRLPGR